MSEGRTTLSDRTQVYPGHREIDPKTGMQKGYVVLAEEEVAKGYVRPFRKSYKHLKCGVVTTMGDTIAATYAREPGFCNGTFCCGSRMIVSSGRAKTFRPRVIWMVVLLTGCFSTAWRSSRPR